jgi:hypothetical protein
MTALKFTIASIKQSRNCSLIGGTEETWLQLARLTQAAVYLSCTGVVPCLNLSWGIGYPDYGFFVLRQTFQVFMGWHFWIDSSRQI